MFNVCTLLPVYNGEKYIKEWLEHTEKFSDLRIILDDCSTDKTVKIIEDYKKNKGIKELILINKQNKIEFNDLENRNVLLGELYKYNVNWGIWLDIDEKFKEDQIELLKQTLNHCYKTKYDVIMTPMVHLWDSENTFRTDFSLAWVEGIEPKTRIWRIQNKVKLVIDKKLHFCLVPDIQNKRYISDILMIHSGYLNKKIRENKYKFYKKQDKDNQIGDTAAGNYEYMLQKNITLNYIDNIDAELLIKYRKEIEKWS